MAVQHADLTGALVAFLIVSFISWILRLAKNQQAEPQAPARRPQAKPARPARQRPAQPRAARPAPEARPRRSAPPAEAGAGRTHSSESPTRSQSAPPVPVYEANQIEVIDDESGQGEQLSQHHLQSQIQNRHISETQRSQPETESVSEALASDQVGASIVELLTNPQHVRQAIVLNEILQRPVSRRNR